MTELFNESAFHESDTFYWTRAISEIIYSYFLRLVDPCLKDKALKIHKQLEEFKRHLPVSSCDLRETDRDNFNMHARTAKEFLKEVLYKITNCVVNLDFEAKAWYGFVKPSSVEAHIAQINYARARINCLPIRHKTVIKFWANTNLEILLNVAHELDPSERSLIEGAYRIGYKIQKKEHCSLRKLGKETIKETKDVDEFFRVLKCLNSRNNVRTSLHPADLTHALRLIQRALRDLVKLYCHHLKKSKCDSSETEECDAIQMCDLDDYVDVECNKCCKWPEALEVDNTQICKEIHCCKEWQKNRASYNEKLDKWCCKQKESKNIGLDFGGIIYHSA